MLVSNGDEAWDILNGCDPPQIAVLDWNMPGRTGVEVCEECQKKNLSVYRILLTAKETNEDIIYALDRGAHDFKSKPIIPGIMKSRLAVGKKIIEQTIELLRSEQLAAVGSLVSGVSHHFNNLNMPILMYSTSILNKKDLSPDVRKKIETIAKAAKKAGELTETLMSIASNKKQEKKRVSFNHLITDVLEIESLSFDKQGITVIKDFNLIPDVFIRESEIHHVVMNLIVNASHSLIASDRKEISLKTGIKNGLVYLKVTDTGCGIASNKLQKIFSPFYSEKGEFAEANSPLNAVRGTGIGLFASKTIASGHGANISVESEVGTGSIFTLWLPFAEK